MRPCCGGIRASPFETPRLQRGSSGGGATVVRDAEVADVRIQGVFLPAAPVRRLRKVQKCTFRRSRRDVRPARRKIMTLKTILLATTAFTVAGLVAAQAQTLSGKVSSTEEGQMEGVLVSAKKEG